MFSVQAVKLWREKKTSPVGLEPTTFELEVQCANPLRHGDPWDRRALRMAVIAKYIPTRRYVHYVT